jgi:hypothetical protein
MNKALMSLAKLGVPSSVFPYTKYKSFPFPVQRLALDFWLLAFRVSSFELCFEFRVLLGLILGCMMLEA